MKEEIIDYIFKNNIDKIVYGIPTENIEEVRNYYKNYSQRYVCNLEELIAMGQKKGFSPEEAVKKIKEKFNIVEQNNRWEEKSVEEKSRLLIKDSALQRIKELSEKAFMYADAKRNNQENPNENILVEPITDEELKTIQNEMEALLEQVKEFNLPEARHLVSEGLVDIEYVLGSDKMSFRNSH